MGVGLIGGSLGLVWKKNHPDITIVGFDHPAVLDEAFERGAIDIKAAGCKAAVREADLVVLSAPITSILQLMAEMAPHLKRGAYVTDVGSVKKPVVEFAREVLTGENPFFGGHPMAGSEKGGISNADPLLFESATYVLSPPGNVTTETFPATYPDFINLIEDTGGRLLFLDADRHDRIAAVVSHLPQMLAVALMNFADEKNQEDDAFLRLAAGGFRDMTRIASSPFEMWRDIVIANNGPILETLAGFVTAIQNIRHRVALEDFEALEGAFKHSREARDSIPKNTKGFLHPLSDIYVYAEDKPGELFNIVRVVHEASLNIKDMELLKIREGTGGAFRISFSNDTAADMATRALNAANYTSYRLDR